MLKEGIDNTANTKVGTDGLEEDKNGLKLRVFENPLA